MFYKNSGISQNKGSFPRNFVSHSGIGEFHRVNVLALLSP